MVFAYAGLIAAGTLYEDERKNGNLKNTVAFGISREKIFVGKCVTAVLLASVLMAVTLCAYIVSAWLLLEHTGPTTLQVLLTEIPVVYGDCSSIYDFRNRVTFIFSKSDYSNCIVDGDYPGDTRYFTAGRYVFTGAVEYRFFVGVRTASACHLFSMEESVNRSAL